MRAESAVEPTRSENITVTWRRSAAVSLVGSAAVAEAGDGAGSAFVFERRSAIALSNARRCPTTETPKSFKSSAVRLGRSFSVMAFSRKAASYCSRPRPRNHTAKSMTASS
jgi:hypothetical protein